MAERVERERRVALLLPVHLELRGRRVTGLAANISRHGIYVRTEEDVSLGDVVELAIAFPNGRLIHVLARAVHRLDARTARKLGRFAGVGFQLMPDATGELRALARLIDQVAGEACAPVRPTEPLRILIAESDARLLARMTTILDDAGYLVESASNGVEAFSLCLERRPDLLLCAERIPLMSGPAIAAKLAREGVNIPTCSLHKPFTDEELRDCVGAALHELRDQSTSQRTSLAALLSTLEAGRKSGLVLASCGSAKVELRVRDGNIVRVAPASATSARQRILDLLEWTDGRFEFLPATISDADEVGCSISRLLLDHSRLQDHLMEATTSVWQATL